MVTVTVCLMVTVVVVRTTGVVEVDATVVAAAWTALYTEVDVVETALALVSTVVAAAATAAATVVVGAT